MGDPRLCCLMAVCCPPGSAAQRASLKAWLVDVVLAGLAMTYEARERMAEGHVAALPWGKTAADFAEPATQADTTGEAV